MFLGRRCGFHPPSGHCQPISQARAAAKHTASIFQRLGLQPSDDDSRRVPAVIAYLGR
ncbi:MAG: hypothetical protein ACM3ML_36850 [Micromonosporaceae bacterium]